MNTWRVVIACAVTLLMLPSALQAQQATDAGARDAGARDAGRGDAGPTDSGVDGGADADTTDGTGADAIPIDAGPVPPRDLLPEDLRPDVQISVTPEQGLMTGDLVEVRLTFETAAGDEVAVPRQDFAPFELHGESSHEPGETVGGRRNHTVTLPLIALEPGDFELDPIRLQLITEDDELGSFLSPTVAIRVGSVLGNEPDAQPKPPTDPLEVLEEDYTIAWALGTLVTLLLLGLMMFLLATWWLKRDKPEAPPPPPRPAWELALEKLQVLKREMGAHVESGQLQTFADELSDVMREYFGNRYGFDGLERTTDEVLTEVRKKKPRGVTVEEIAALLGDLDLIKFAKASSALETCADQVETATRIVNSTTPRGSFAASAPQSRPASQPGART